MKIELNFNREDFEELYFRDNSLSYFNNIQAIRLWMFIILTLLSIGVLFINVNSIAIVFCFIGITIFQFVKFFIHLFEIRKNKKDIDNYLSDLEKVEKFELELGEYSITLIVDSEEFEYLWDKITKIEFNSICTILYESNLQHLMIPTKSMKVEDYEGFIKIIEGKKEMINSGYNKS